MSHTGTTSTAAAPRRSAAQRALVVVLAVLGVLAIVVAIMFITGAANSIHPLSGSVHHGHHVIRLTVSLVVGVLLLAAASYFARTSSKSLHFDTWLPRTPCCPFSAAAAPAPGTSFVALRCRFVALGRT
ncbi:MAG: hypothetical protein J2P28_00870 [Actinobacteria bacterium]|nr:hypothetical protein [Actinomycetota bacterium]MBO0834053.1 hypothetical protein [Actinomycetota bacterium]